MQRGCAQEGAGGGGREVHRQPAQASPTYFKAGLRIRINFIRIRIQHLRLNTNTDPDSDPIRIQGFNNQKFKKNYS